MTFGVGREAVAIQRGKGEASLTMRATAVSTQAVRGALKPSNDAFQVDTFQC
jgi:hypothetical protein